MSILLYFLATFLALMPLSILSEGVKYSKYFPSIPEPIDEKTFPVDLMLITMSDVILVKCPGPEYKYANDSRKFGPYKYFGELELIYDTNNSLFTWVPLMKRPHGHVFINCGAFNIDDTTVYHRYDWDLNIEWEIYGNPSNLSEPAHITSLVPLMHKKCSNSSAYDTLVFTKDKNDNLVRVSSSNDNVVYIRKKFYYFQKPKEDDVKEVMEPCAITIATSTCPFIVLPEFIVNTMMPSGVITIGMVDAKKATHVQLLSGLLPHFYDGEVISYSRMSFFKDRFINVMGSSKNIISQFDVNVYDIVQLTYKCLEASGEYNIISKIFYFEPKTPEHGLEKVAYVKEDPKIQPNCSLTFLNIGSLESVTYDGTTITSDKWDDTHRNDERFRLKDGKIFLMDIYDRYTELQCVYRTPGRKITEIKEFLAGKYVINHDGGISIDTRLLGNLPYE